VSFVRDSPSNIKANKLLPRLALDYLNNNKTETPDDSKLPPTRHYFKWDKYIYTTVNPKNVRLLYSFGIFGLVLASAGLISLLNLSWWMWLIFGPITLIALGTRAYSYIINLAYPGFDINKHEKLVNHYWLHNQPVKVSILLPICGESLSIIQKTWESVKANNYSNYEVLVLDDKGDNSVKGLANQFGFEYYSRPNKQEFKKSGNLQYGYEHSNGEFVLVLDADFAVHPDFLRDTLPYMFNNPRLGILQTPQYFGDDTNKTLVEKGLSCLVEDFYRVILPVRDRFGGAMCVGTSALYRRIAVEKSGGSPRVNDSEDVRQGLKCSEVGYTTQYLPLVLSRGLCPNNLESAFKQHNRWCSGSVELFLSNEIDQAKLSLIGKLNHSMNFWYYVSESLGPFFLLQSLIVLLFYYDKIRIENVLLFGPLLIFNLFLLPNFKLSSSGSATRLAAINNIFTYTYTIPTRLLNQKLAWVSSNTSLPGVSSAFLQMSSIAFGYTFIASLILAASIILNPGILGNLAALLILVWVCTNLFWYYFYNLKLISYVWNKKAAENQFWVLLSLVGSRVTFTLSGLVLIIISLFYSPAIPSLEAQSIVSVRSLQSALEQIKNDNQSKIVTVSSTCSSSRQYVNPTILASNKFNSGGSYYEFEIKKGQTLISLAAVAVADYQIEFGVNNLDTIQLTQVQNCLVFSRSANIIAAGAKIRFTAEEINRLINRSQALTAQERKVWEEWTVKSRF